LRIALAQLNTRVGAIDANTKKVLDCAARARDELHCDLVLFPELTLCGYPPEDLLLHRGLRSRVEAAFAKVKEGVRGVAVYLGYPEYDGDAIYNSAALIRDGAVLANHRKIALPNYAVFDEKRWFTPGEAATVVDLDGVKLGLIICEDVWVPGPCRAPAQAGAQAILVINGSPFHMSQQRVREQVLAARAKENSLPLLYVNMVGGQDELVFDGGSLCVDSAGEVRLRAPLFEEGLYVVELDRRSGKLEPVADAPPAPTPPLAERVYGALVLGTRDYVNKNGFAGTVLGLSGGVDSALTLAIAVDALAKRLGVRFDTLPIEPLFETTLATLREVLAGRPPDTTEENIQARCRGLLLMAISNKLGEMLLSTGNKSEMAVGYATLYGDMAGGFAPLKDCTKTLVYQLAGYRNSIAPAIPERVIARPPTAELRDNQKDRDSLPPYDVLDAILEAFIEKDSSVDQITALGFDRATVVRVLQMVKRAEYKRRQAPPGVRVSNRAFGRDWRYPITSGY
jgi:NAD+ synthase (glutamine-hydrolysing)